MINIDITVKYTIVYFKSGNKVNHLYVSGWKNRTQINREYPTLNIISCKLISAYTAIPINLIIDNTMKQKEITLDYENKLIKKQEER